MLENDASPHQGHLKVTQSHLFWHVCEHSVVS